MYCRQCGAYLPAGADACPRCRVLVEPQRVVPLESGELVTQVSARAAPKPPRNYWPALAGCLSLLVLALGGMVVYFGLTLQGQLDSTKKPLPLPSSSPVVAPMMRAEPPPEGPSAISELRIGNDPSAALPVSEFNRSQSVYALTTVSVTGSFKVTARLFFDDVPGEQQGPISGLEKTLIMPGPGVVTFTFNPPPAGWPRGTYKIEVQAVDSDGRRRGKQTALFNAS